MKPIDVFHKLFGIAYELTNRSSLRRKPENQRGKPGELLNKLSTEERKILDNLSSDDIADEKKIERGLIDLSAYPDSFSLLEKQAKEDLSNSKIEFDKKIIK